MKKLIVFAASAMLLIIGWRLPTVWHSDALGLAAGMVLGILAPLPCLLMFVVAEYRRKNHSPRREDAQPQPPHITVIDNSQHIHIIPEAVQAHAQRFGGVAEWEGDRWVIVDPTTGKRLARQRMLTG